MATTATTTTTNSNKRSKLDVAAIAWEHYRNFLDSQQQQEGNGDVDELVELLELLKPHVLVPTYRNKAASSDFTTIESLLPVLCSVAHYHLAEYAIGSSVDQDNNNENDQNKTTAEILQHLERSLYYFPINAATWSIGANYARMSMNMPLTQVCRAYIRAADYACQLRSMALSLLNDDDGDAQVQDVHVKEWIELLLMDGIVGAEFVDDDDGGGDDGDGGEGDGEVQEMNGSITTASCSTENDDNKRDDNKIDGATNDARNENDGSNDDDGGGGGYFSSSTVEATSRFMAAMLLSTMGKHNEALEQLRKFHLTHRLHPNVWSPLSLSLSSTMTASPALRASSEPRSHHYQPYLFPTDALPPSLYDRLCRVLAPDAPYWKESDYAHRGYYSYFMEINGDKSNNNKQDGGVMVVNNLVEDVIVLHLLPRAQQILSQRQQAANGDDGDRSSSSDTITDHEKIVGAEWWPHTRPIEANLGHQMHFDTDEALLAQEGQITHPILSSVLYLTTGTNNSNNDDCNDDTATGAAGATIVLNQTPDSDKVASSAWKSVPRDNRFMVFPGNLLHGVLPCPGREGISSEEEEEQGGATTTDALDRLDMGKAFEWSGSCRQEDSIDGNDALPSAKQQQQYRLTFMVGFWTRNVPEKMKERRLYGPCGPLPPATEKHSWVKEIQKGYPKEVNASNDCGNGEAIEKSLEVAALREVSPAWETISVDQDDETENVGNNDDPALELPKGLDHRFFVRGAPECFRDSLFQKDDE